MVPGIPAHYDSRYGVTSTAHMLSLILSHRSVREAAFLSFSGELAFFMRPGLLEAVATTMRVTPQRASVDEAVAFATKQGLKFSGSDRSNPDGPQAGQPYLALHLRQRENECMKEMKHTWADATSEDLAFAIPPEARKTIEGHCAYTAAQFTALHAAVTGGRHRTVGSHGSTLRYFLASDHQNQALERDLVSKGAVMYDGGKFTTQEKGNGALQGLGVDFYLLLRAAAFTGNQLSSISQNACFWRLGHGLGCDGFYADFTLHHARSVDHQRFIANVLDLVV